MTALDAAPHRGTRPARADRPKRRGPRTLRSSRPSPAPRPGTPAPARQPDASAGLPDLSHLKILIVDDEADARELLQFVLTRFHADVHTAASAAEALAILDSFLPDVLLSDIGMPGMDGCEFIRAVRQRPPERGGHVPAAAVTASARIEDRSRALGSGFQVHVPKPVDVVDLLGVVTALASPRPR
jgi:CheY-like chemotaxis protein